MPILDRPPSRAKVEIITGKGSKTLPAKGALNALAKTKKTINDYSKAGTAIDDYPPQKPR